MCFCHGINQVSIPGATVRNIERQPFSITMPAQAPQTVARLTVTFDRVPRGGSASFYQPPPMLIDHEVRSSHLIFGVYDAIPLTGRVLALFETRWDVGAQVSALWLTSLRVN